MSTKKLADIIRGNVQVFFRKGLMPGLVCILLVTVTACSNTQRNNSNSVLQNDIASTESLEIPVEAGSWKINSIGEDAMTVTSDSLDIQFGAQIAIDEINASGGIRGYMIEFSFLEDDSCFGLVPSGASVDVIAYPTDRFLASLQDSDIGEDCAWYIHTNHIAKTAAIIYNHMDVYSTDVYEKFLEAAENYSIKIAAVETYSSENDQDVTTLLETVRSAGAELLFLPVSCEEAAIILTQADAIGYKPMILGCDTMDGILGLENFDVSFAEGVILPMFFLSDTENEATVNFVTKYQQMYGVMPSQLAAAAYDAVYIIKAALEKTGAVPDMSMQEIGEAFKEALTAVSFDGLTGTGMTWNTSGEVSDLPRFVIIRDGVYEVIKE